MSRRWFGTDGIRGEAGRPPLVPDFLRCLGVALGEAARAEGAAAGPAPRRGGAATDSGLVLIGRDTRESGPAIVEALAAGLRAAGARVVDLGVLPTAALPVAMRERGAAAGLVVSASHNPWRDNGIKVFGRGGAKLSDEREAALEARIAALGGAAPGVPGAPGAERGTGAAGAGSTPGAAPALERVDGAAEWSRWLARRFAGLDLSGLSLAVDCANGAACSVAPALLAGFGARVTALFDQPDGRNINEGCGSTHLAPLAGAVGGGGFDLGLAFDGDADRVLLVDRAGRTCDGDHMLGFLGPWLDGRGELPGRVVVASVMSNLGLERALAAAGLALLRCPVGDRHVLAAMAAGGHGLGGEASGHVIFRERGHFIGDGLYTALVLLTSLRDRRTDLAAVIDAVPRVPQVLLNVAVASRPPVESLAGLQAAVQAAQARHGADVRIVLRYSGTENLARVMVEGLDAGVVARLADDLARLWTEEIRAHAR